MIAAYLALLDNQLLNLKLNRHQRAVVLSDIEKRLQSLLHHWHDVPFRNTGHRERTGGVLAAHERLTGGSVARREHGPEQRPD